MRDAGRRGRLPDSLGARAIGVQPDISTIDYSKEGGLGSSNLRAMLVWLGGEHLWVCSEHSLRSNWCPSDLMKEVVQALPVAEQ